MLVERNSKEIIVRLPASIDPEDLQNFLDYARYKELTSGYRIDQKTVNALAEKVNRNWWAKNCRKKHR
jgi:hypothetical protein